MTDDLTEPVPVTFDGLRNAWLDLGEAEGDFLDANPYDKFLTLSHSDRQSIVRMIDHKIDMKRTGMKLPEWAGPERQPGQEG